ncbi:MAG TPA: hypothetical protein EYG21_01480 [Nitrospinaceae bacterium]|nr:hypothetical protein [Nitrospinaceae bacterium]
MIISKCPLRVSLCGGSTDSPSFIKKFGRGQVISFTPSLYTYSTLHKDVNGFNNFKKKYLISYSQAESCSSIAKIQNDVVRIVLEHFETDPLKVSLHADVFSFGSGLASSSSYILNLVSGLNILHNLNLPLAEICRIAFKLEKKLNPYNGYQDTYGCAFGGLKLMKFNRNGYVSHELLPNTLFDRFDFYLIYTNIQRRSQTILQSIDIDKSQPLLHDVDVMYQCIKENNFLKFFRTLGLSWKTKKQTSPEIINCKELRSLDQRLEVDESILAHKLCGAGGGGYFLAVTNKNTKIKLDKSTPYIRIFLEKKDLYSHIL